MKNTWVRNLVKDMWKAGFEYSSKKMEAAAHDNDGWSEVV